MAVLPVLDIIERILPSLESVDGFIARYVELVVDDAAIRFAHKMAWNNTVRTTVRL